MHLAYHLGQDMGLHNKVEVVRLFVCLSVFPLQVSGHMPGPIQLKICMHVTYYLGKDMSCFETACKLLKSYFFPEHVHSNIA